MKALEQYKALLEEFGEKSGVKATADENGVVTIMYGDIAVNLSFLPDSESLTLFCTLGFLGDDPYIHKRVATLMVLNGKPYETGGFVFSLDRYDDNRILVHDTRDFKEIYSADILAGWMESMVGLVLSVRKTMIEDFPYDDPNEDASGESDMEDDAE